MTCVKCNNLIPEDSEFCPFCGTALKSVETSAAETENKTLNCENSNKNDINSHKEMKSHIAAAAETEETSEKEKRYCKMCGGLIDPDTRKCTSCGKQYLKIKKITLTKPLFTALVIIFLLVALNIIQLVNLDERKTQIALLNSTIESKEEEIDDYIESFSEEKEENDFFNEHIVFVSDDGTGLYHKYGCPEFDDSSFWAFNTESAKAKGYDPCRECFWYS